MHNKQQKLCLNPFMGLARHEFNERNYNRSAGMIKTSRRMISNSSRPCYIDLLQRTMKNYTETYGRSEIVLKI